MCVFMLVGVEGTKGGRIQTTENSLMGLLGFFYFLLSLVSSPRSAQRYYLSIYIHFPLHTRVPAVSLAILTNIFSSRGKNSNGELAECYSARFLGKQSSWWKNLRIEETLELGRVNKFSFSGKSLGRIRLLRHPRAHFLRVPSNNLPL